MNRRQFLTGATTAAVVVAVPVAAVGQQERFLVKNLGLPAAAQEVSDAEDWEDRYSHDWAEAGRVMDSAMLLMGAYWAAMGQPAPA